MQPDILAARLTPPSAPRGPWRLALAYAWHMLMGGGVRRAVRYLARALVSPRATGRWLAYVETGPVRQAPLAARLDLAQKIYRPLCRRDLGLTRRIDLLQAHYDSLADRLSASAIARLAAGRPIVLATLSGRSGRRYHLTVARDCRFGKEGELTLGLRACDPDMALAVVTILIARPPGGGRLVSIGGLQGPARPHGRDDVVAATRDLHGLRPKRAAVAAACMLARWVDAGGIVAAANDTHVGHSLPRRMPVHADYDAFWIELGGIRRADGDFDLPIQPPQRSIADVPAKKRRDWLRRATMLDDLAGQLRRSLDAAL